MSTRVALDDVRFGGRCQTQQEVGKQNPPRMHERLPDDTSSKRVRHYERTVLLGAKLASLFHNPSLLKICTVGIYFLGLPAARIKESVQFGLLLHAVCQSVLLGGQLL